jgi:hypothetical protein
LTVSHVLPLIPALSKNEKDLPSAAFHQARMINAPRPDAAPSHVDCLDRRVQQRRVPSAGIFTGEPFILPAETSPILLRKCSSAIQQAFVRFAVTGGASCT